MNATPAADAGRLVVALGGNALVVRGETADAAPQMHNVRAAVEALAPLARDHQLIITHGNGPQVGLLALESAADPHLQVPYPLDALGAETQGLIGYWLLQALGNVLGDRPVVALITQTIVSDTDPAFRRPSKFVGRTYTEDEARAMAAARSWTVKADGPGWRRVVASPAPQAVVEMDLIEQLLDGGAVVVCGGGGGIPVARDRSGDLEGVEAVIDKDATSALIAESVHADALLLLTDVAAVSTDVDDPGAPTIGQTTPASLRHQVFAAGSMGPKVDAACRFVEHTGAMAAIGALTEAAAILAGRAGTIVTGSGRYAPVEVFRTSPAVGGGRQPIAPA
jgi:carbamate kinase